MIAITNMQTTLNNDKVRINKRFLRMLKFIYTLVIIVKEIVA